MQGCCGWAVVEDSLAQCVSSFDPSFDGQTELHLGHQQLQQRQALQKLPIPEQNQLIENLTSTHRPDKPVRLHCCTCMRIQLQRACCTQLCFRRHMMGATKQDPRQLLVERCLDLKGEADMPSRPCKFLQQSSACGFVKCNNRWRKDQESLAYIGQGIQDIVQGSCRKLRASHA